MAKPKAKQLNIQVPLTLGIFAIQTEQDVDADTEAPDVTGDFETWDKFSSSIASGRADIYYSGQLDPTESKIVEIKVPIKAGSTGSPQYVLKVYVEASSPPHTQAYTSGAAAAPPGGTSRFVITLTNSNLSSQPVGEGRYHVLVEAHIDNGEVLYVGRPRVKHR